MTLIADFPFSREMAIAAVDGKKVASTRREMEKSELIISSWKVTRMISDETSTWITEIRREIKRLDNKLRRLGQIENKTSEQWEDFDNWKGWRDALRWALAMRDGKSSRKQAWGKTEEPATYPYHCFGQFATCAGSGIGCRWKDACKAKTEISQNNCSGKTNKRKGQNNGNNSTKN